MTGQHVAWLPSASSAARSVACPGWAALTYYYRHRLPPEDNTYSLPGDHAHALIEAGIKGLEPPAESVDFLQQDDAEQQHSAAVDFALYTIRKYTKKHGGRYASEAFVSIFPEYNFKGHIDYTLISLNKGLLTVADYKHGVGVPVHAKDNWQGISYLSGARRLLGDQYHKKIKKLRFVVIQPRCSQVDPVQMHTYKRKDFNEREKLLRAAIGSTAGALTNTRSSNLKPAKKNLNRGDHCQFCTVKPMCPKWFDVARVAADQYQGDKELNPQAYPDVSQQDLERLLIDTAGIDGYLKKGREAATAAIIKGKGANVAKLVDGATRQYLRPDARKILKKALKNNQIDKDQFDACFKVQFVTLAQIRQTIPASVYNALVRDTQNRQSLVASSDKRKSNIERIKGVFKNG